VTLECLRGSTLLSKLRKVGYDVTEIGDVEGISYPPRSSRNSSPVPTLTGA
jgi:hypothetical protein